MTPKTIAVLALCAIMAAPEAHATVWTVSNHPISIAQFTDLQSAHDAAGAGDTIYVHPSQVPYAEVDITKPLTVLGPGSHPQGQGGLTAQLNQIRFFNGSAGSEVKGVSISNLEVNSEDAGGYLIRQNYINSLYLANGSGWVSDVVVVNNVFNNLAPIINSGGYALDCLFGNNVIYCSTLSFGSPAGSAGNVFLNNIVIGINPDNSALVGLANCTIAHNIIFGGADFPGNPNHYCDFNNNLFFGNYTLPGLLGVGSSASGNVMGPAADPLFVESTMLNTDYFNLNPQPPYPDLHLQPGSPAVNMAQGGGDIGIYAGAFPWPDNAAEAGKWTYYPPARLPEVITLTSPGTAPVDQPVQVTITGKNAN